MPLDQIDSNFSRGDSGFGNGGIGFSRRASDNDPNANRRVTDGPSQLPTNLDILNAVKDMHADIEALERSLTEMTTAFTVNDINKPDFDGHRKAHLKITKNEDIIDNYKIDATKKIVGAAVVFILGLISSGMLTKLTDLFHK